DQAATALAQFLQSERVNARTDDDKTLVLAARLPIPAVSEETLLEADDAPVDVPASSVLRPPSEEEAP
ncbi:MAG: protein phosphatase 2C domain-containing protein, partial [Anaerolineae bacterium]|nr:protein phosphatase 2C domain-containing protein [Anaerolineae bacterium]